MMAGMHRDTMRSAALFAEAQRVFPGGVNSPVRAFRAVGGVPPFIASARGSRVTDVDGNSYIDYVGSWGPLIAGHAHPAVVQAIQETAALGSSYGAPTEIETRLAEAIIAKMPSIERLRFTSSGTEAAMSAVRLARAATGRDLLIKFDGCYHGHVDSLLVAAGSGALTLGQPDSPGVPATVTGGTLPLPFNDLGAVEAAFAQHGDRIAAVLTEPVAGNMGVIEPLPGYLEGLRAITRRHGALLVFDEVITGFRVAPGGAQERYGVTPDLTILGKIIGGGMPVGAFGGPAAIMDQLAPSGPVYHAGTLSGNPVAMAAGLATLRLIADPVVYGELDRKAARLAAGLLDAARRAGVPATGSRVGSMQTLFFSAEPVTDYASAKGADTACYGAFHGAMLDRGVYFAPSQFEAAIVSLAHGDEDIEATISAAEVVLQSISAT